MEEEIGWLKVGALNNKLNSGLIHRLRENQGQDWREGNNELGFKFGGCEMVLYDWG